MHPRTILKSTLYPFHKYLPAGQPESSPRLPNKPDQVTRQDNGKQHHSDIDLRGRLLYHFIRKRKGKKKNRSKTDLIRSKKTDKHKDT